MAYVFAAPEVKVVVKELTDVCSSLRTTLAVTWEASSLPSLRAPPDQASYLVCWWRAEGGQGGGNGSVPYEGDMVRQRRWDG